MKDREFLELLNLYIDHEITPDDAVRLEAEVAARPDRRELYSQYCKMQKACSMLSGQFANAPVRAVPEHARGTWAFGPALAGLAAACVIVVVGLRLGGFFTGAEARHPAAPALASAPVAPRQQDAMQPVFLVRAPGIQQAPSAMGSVFVSYNPLRQAPQLDWIGAVQLSPVLASPSPELRLGIRTGLRAVNVSDAQGGRDAQQQGEMAAFRFQR